MFKKKAVKRSRETVKEILQNDKITPQEKKSHLLTEYCAIHQWKLRNKKYEKELREQIENFFQKVEECSENIFVDEFWQFIRSH